MISLLLLGVSSAVSIALVALNKNINLFFSPSQIAAGEAPVGVTFRLGGMVVTGSVNRDPGSLNVTFNLTDTAQHINVEYSGILPDLFREGQGIVAMGSLVNGRFVATEVLAKHDENYMPPEVKEALKQAELAGVSRVNNQ